MTPRLAPDIDRLLWEVAESQDPAAFDDFEVRFPHLVVELGKRIKLVRELRDARTNGDVRSPMPRFDRRQPSRTLQMTPALAVMGVLLLGALGFGAYSLTSRAVSTHQIVGQQQGSVPAEPAPLPKQAPTFVAPHTDPQNITTAPPPSSPDSGVPPSQQHMPLYLRPTNVSFDRARLQVALTAVAASGGLEIEFAPNTPNPEVQMDYRGMTAIDILKDLGAKFGFTAFNQGSNRVLIVPARDPNAAEDQVTAGSGTATNLDDPAAVPDTSTGGNPKKGKASPVKHTP